jgi:hypothetical protein
MRNTPISRLGRWSSEPAQLPRLKPSHKSDLLRVAASHVRWAEGERVRGWFDAEDEAKKYRARQLAQIDESPLGR